MDPIVALVTPPVPGPVGIIRLSGPDLLRQFSRAFLSLPDQPVPRHAYLASVCDGEGSPIDEGLILYFRSPDSFTGEDVIECQMHGNPHSLRAIQKRLIALGAREALPGEFSYRAYLHHKMTLLKAESLNRMISAPSYQHFLGGFSDYTAPESDPVARLREEVIDLLAHFYVAVDHLDLPEEEAPDPENLLSRLDHLIVKTRTMLEDQKKGLKQRSGFTVALIGHPNSGKSSLFNRLLGESRALVSTVPGTTRDVIEGRYPTPHGDIVLLDTAGIRLTDDPLEKAGIRMTRSLLREISLAVFLVSPENLSPVALSPKGDFLTVLNKSDLLARKILPSLLKTMNSRFTPVYPVSSKTGQGVSEFLEALSERARVYYEETGRGVSGASSCLRRDLLSGFLRELKQSRLALSRGQLMEALHGIELFRGEWEKLFGVVSHGEVYDRVFASFCIGK